MAKMVKAFYQGKDWKQGNKKVVAHRAHRVHIDRKKRTRLGSPPEEHKRRGKRHNWWRNWRLEEVRKHRFDKWKKENPEKSNRENPFRVKPPEFKNTEMRDALIAAGVVKA